MKKRILILGTLLCLALTGCNGSDEKETQASTETEADTNDTSDTAEDMDIQEETEDPTPVVDATVEKEGLDKFITLGEYKNLDLTKTATAVSDEEIEYSISNDLLTNAEEIEDGTIEDGDIANIDYEGKIDGVAFDGGSQEGADLVIGSGSFIDTFEEQLIGCKTGETKEITVTFPEEYGSEDLNGKEAVFTVTINAIKRAPSELTDEWVKANSDFKTADEYRANVKTQIEESYETSALSSMQNEAFEMVYESSEFLQYPKNLVDEYTVLMDESYKSYAEYYGMEYEEFLSSYGMTEVSLSNAAKSNVRTALIVDAIFEEEGIAMDGDVFQERLSKTLEENNFSSLDEALETGASEEDIHRTVKYLCVVDAIVGYANIIEE